MQEDYVLNMYLCRDTEFIIGASICMQGKGLADWFELHNLQDN